MAQASRLPRQLGESDRLTILKVLGFGSSAKLNVDPRPLGGKLGWEFYLSNEMISLSRLQGLGDGTASGNQMVTTLGFGKGLFYDVDTFIFFTPLQAQSLYTQMGGFVRWRAYRDFKNPWQVSFNFHSVGSSFENLVFVIVSGVDAIASYEWSRWALSTGVGQGRAIGNFVGGAQGIVSTVGNANPESAGVDLQQTHFLVSASYRWDRSYLSVQYDRYIEGVYGLRWGYRF